MKLLLAMTSLLPLLLLGGCPNSGELTSAVTGRNLGQRHFAGSGRLGHLRRQRLDFEGRRRADI